MPRFLKYLLLSVLLVALLGRGHASGLHHHVSTCEAAQEICCAHTSPHQQEAESYPLPCGHQCHEDVPDSFGVPGLASQSLLKPFPRVVAWISSLAVSPPQTQLPQRFKTLGNGPPPPVHPRRDTERLL